VDVSQNISDLPEEIQKEIIILSYYELYPNYEIADNINDKYGYDYDENDIQLFLQRKMPSDAATSVVLFEELKRGSLIDEQTNIALNKVAIYRAETFIRLHEEVNSAVKHMHEFIKAHKKDDKENEDGEVEGFYDPEIYKTYLDSLKTLSKISTDLFKMADPVKIVSTGMKGITKEYTLEVAAIISEFIKEIITGIREGEDAEEVSISAVKKTGAMLNDATEEFLEKVETISKNKTLGASF